MAKHKASRVQFRDLIPAYKRINNTVLAKLFVAINHFIMTDDSKVGHGPVVFAGSKLLIPIPVLVSSDTDQADFERFREAIAALAEPSITLEPEETIALPTGGEVYGWTLGIPLGDAGIQNIAERLIAYANARQDKSVSYESASKSQNLEILGYCLPIPSGLFVGAKFAYPVS